MIDREVEEGRFRYTGQRDRIEEFGIRNADFGIRRA